MRAAYGEKTRNFFANKTNPKILIDFAGQQVFESATVDVNILLLEKNENEQNTVSCIIKEDCKNNMTDYIRQHGNTVSFSAIGQSWVILSDIEKRIKEKIEKIGKPLKDWDINIYRGILTGCNEAFIIDKNKRDELIKKNENSAEIIRPILRGRDIKRYGYEFAELYLLYIPWHFPLHLDQTITGVSKLAEKRFKEEYPAVYNHLLQYKDILSARNTAETGIRYEWYALQRWGANYWDDFSKQKIIYPDIMRMPKNFDLLNTYPYFYLDNNGFYAEATNFILTGNDLETIFSFLVSDIGFYIFSKYYSGPQFDATGFRYKKEYINNLHIPVLNQIDRKKLKFHFNQNSSDIKTIDKIAEEIFIKRIGLENNEIEMIKNYKISLLSAEKTGI